MKEIEKPIDNKIHKYTSKNSEILNQYCDDEKKEQWQIVYNTYNILKSIEG